MKHVIVAGLLAVALLVAGCQEGQVLREGTVLGESAKLAEMGPSMDLAFKTADGREMRLSQTTYPLMFVGFISPPTETCCFLDSRLTELSTDFMFSPASIVQMSLPTADCPHGAGCFEVCSLPKIHMMALCDAQKIAWKQYGQPKAGTVFLVHRGRIIDKASIDNLDTLRQKATDMINAEAQMQQLPW